MYNNRFWFEESGQGLAEYGLIIGLISLVAILALTSSGTSISGMFETISSKLDSTSSSIAASGS